MKKNNKELLMEQNKKLLPYVIVMIIIGIILQFFDSIEGSIIKMIFWGISLVFLAFFYIKNKYLILKK
jgi:uncharacterized membrane protein